MEQKVILPNSVIRQSLDQVATEIDGEVVIMSIDRGNYYSMNTVLSSIWGWLDEPMTMAAICARLTATYEVTPEIAETDVRNVLNELLQEGLIEIR